MSSTAREVGKTVRLGLRSWGATVRLVILIIVVVWLCGSAHPLSTTAW